MHICILPCLPAALNDRFDPSCRCCPQTAAAAPGRSREGARHYAGALQQGAEPPCAPYAQARPTGYGVAVEQSAANGWRRGFGTDARSCRVYPRAMHRADAFGRAGLGRSGRTVESPQEDERLVREPAGNSATERRVTRNGLWHKLTLVRSPSARTTGMSRRSPQRLQGWAGEEEAAWLPPRTCRWAAGRRSTARRNAMSRLLGRGLRVLLCFNS